MTDIASQPASRPAPSGLHTGDAAQGAGSRPAMPPKRRFKWLGAGAVALAGAASWCCCCRPSSSRRCRPSRMNYADAAGRPLGGEGRSGESRRGRTTTRIVQDALCGQVPRRDEPAGPPRCCAGCFRPAPASCCARRCSTIRRCSARPSTIALPLDDFADLYLKGLIADEGSVAPIAATVAPSGDDRRHRRRRFGDDSIADGWPRGSGATAGENGVAAPDQRRGVAARRASTAAWSSSRRLAPAPAGRSPRAPSSSRSTAPRRRRAGAATLRVIDTPESSRKISDQEIVWLDELQGAGPGRKPASTRSSSSPAPAASRRLAGIWGAVVGSFLTHDRDARHRRSRSASPRRIYLEEFAPKNRWTNLIEVNINNLAAVPSIVFGLLGLAVFLNFFGLPRSAPLVGGMVLALMTLPIIIIASRAALQAVPPSIREAALGIGASQGADRVPSRAAAGACPAS